MIEAQCGLEITAIILDLEINIDSCRMRVSTLKAPAVAIYCSLVVLRTIHQLLYEKTQTCVTQICAQRILTEHSCRIILVSSLVLLRTWRTLSISH
jgi:hypothetical protein